MCLKKSDGHSIRIIEESAHKYRRIGTHLLGDRYGCRLDTIVNDNRGKSEDIITEVYKTWINEDLDCSWKKLIEYLKISDLKRLASDIEKYLGIHPPTEFQRGSY